MIKIKVAELLGKNKMNRKQLAEMTGIRPNTIGLLYDETIQRIEIEQLEALCKAFKLSSIVELIEYISDESKDK